MAGLIEWYRAEFCQGIERHSSRSAGGIAGDFPICVVPLITQDLREKCRLWAISARFPTARRRMAPTAGRAEPKRSPGEAEAATPRFVIESDASIVAPDVAYILGR